MVGSTFSAIGVNSLSDLILRSGVSRVSKDVATVRATWFETALRASSP